MDISCLPRYPIHDEALPSQCERLLQKDATELWPSIAVVVATCLILVVMTLHFSLYVVGVALGGLAGD